MSVVRVVTEGRQVMRSVNAGIGLFKPIILISNDVILDKPGRTNPFDSMASVCVGNTWFTSKYKLNKNVASRDCAIDRTSKWKLRNVFQEH